MASTEEGLRILTLHGNGLQGLAVITIVDELCSHIAQQNDLAKIPRPCEIFDAICGTGIGAFLALLLARYQLDIQRCKQHYMDLAEYIEESNLSRRSNQKTLREADVHDFLRMLIKNEDWPSSLDFGASEETQRCRHIIVARQSTYHGRKRDPEAVHGVLVDNSVTIKNRYLPAVDIIAASIAQPVDGWICVEQDNDKAYQPRIPLVHNIVSTALQQVVSVIGHPAPVSYVANVGPARVESNSPVNESFGLLSPVLWVQEKASPVKDVVMAPLRATLRQASAQARKRSVSATKDLNDEIHVHADGKQKTHPVDGARSKDASCSQLFTLLNHVDARKMFDFCSTSGRERGDGSDMIDLRETRNNIKDIVAFMNASGLFTDAAKEFGSL